MKLNKKLSAVALFGALIFGSSSAFAVSSYYTELVSIYGSNTGCYVCHTGEKGDMLAFGNAFVNAPGAVSQKLLSLNAVYGDDLRSGGVLPDTKTGEDDEEEGGCITSFASTPLLMMFAMLILGLFVRRK